MREREQLRPRLSAAYAERDQMALVRERARARRGALAQELTAVHDAKEAALTAALTANYQSPRRTRRGGGAPVVGRLARARQPAPSAVRRDFRAEVFEAV